MGYRLFRTSYTDRKGSKREAEKWYVEFRDQLDTVRRLPAFTSKAASEELGRNLVKLVAYHKGSGGQTDPDLSQWVSGLAAAMRDKLVSIGLLDGQRVAGVKLLADHVSDWSAVLAAKGNTGEYVAKATGRVQRVFDGCGFRYFGDICASKVQTSLADLQQDKEEKRGISKQTFNYYLSGLKSFCRWMVRERRAGDSPVSHLDGLNTRTDRRHDRRALAVAELVGLLDAAYHGPDFFGMAGPERATLYELAAETGLRSNELRSLTRSSFQLDGDNPTVHVEAEYSKRRRLDTLPIRPALAAKLRDFLGGKLSAAPAFTMPKPEDVVKMFKRDLDAAGIEYQDNDGRFADFHSLRHTFISNLAAGGVHPKVAQALARHSTITLTMDRYSHTLVGEQSAALSVLPDLSTAGRESAAGNRDG